MCYRVSNLQSGERFAKSYYGNTTIFYVDRASAPKWIKSLADANIQIKSEIRLEFPIRNDRDAWNFLMRFNSECRRAVGFDRSPEFQRSMAKLLRLQIAFGEPVRKVWMSPEDIPVIWGAYLAVMSATEWCEWKFGKMEGAEKRPNSYIPRMNW